MVNYAVVDNGIVINIVVADEQSAADNGWIDATGGRIGDTWDGQGFTRPDVDMETIRKGMSCSKMQGILTLGETAWGEVLTYRETASWEEQMVIDSAQDWNRTSENIAFFGWLLSYTDAQMDAMFTAAVQVTA
jgi:hypothetical protein